MGKTTGLPLFILVACAQVGYAMLNFSAMPIYLTRTRGLSEGVVGLILAAFLVAEVLSKPAAGRASDRFGFAPVFALGCSLSVISITGTLLLPSGSSFWLGMIAFRALDGIAVAMVWTSAYAAAYQGRPEREYQAMASRLNIAYLSGVALAFPLGGLVNEATGRLETSLVAAAGILVVVGAVGFFQLPRRLPRFSAEKDSQPAESASPQRVLGIVRAYPYAAVLAVLLFAGIGFPMFVIKWFAMDELGLSEVQFGALVLPGAIGLAGLAGVMARVTRDWSPRAGVQRGLSACTVGLLGVVLSGQGVPQIPVLLLGAGLVAWGFIVALPAWYAVVGELGKAAQIPTGRLMGAFMAIQGAGSILAAPTGAWLYGGAKLGATAVLAEPLARMAPFAASAVCVAVGWVLVTRIDPRVSRVTRPVTPQPEG